jgi:hypothetical protein
MRVCKSCSKDENTTKFNGRSRSCIECHKARCVERRAFIKLSILAHYSNGETKCGCHGCGESRVEFLTVDHIDGDGRSHRKKIRIPFYEWLWQNEFPPGFRVLCFNCNCSIGQCGYCPHIEKSRIPSLEHLKHVKILPSGRGGRAWNAKLTPDAVRNIKIGKENGVPIKQLARQNGVSPAAIRGILRGETWKHVTTGPS